MFPDPNVGYVFGYESELSDEGIRINFLKGLVRILFRYEDIDRAKVVTYYGGRISWDVIRWGKCPRGTRALEITLKRGIFKRHLIVFEDLEKVIKKLEKYIEVER